MHIFNYLQNFYIYINIYIYIYLPVYFVKVTIHTDTLNESGFVEHSLSAIKGRTIHTYHSEGAGGGHAPDIITGSNIL